MNDTNENIEKQPWFEPVEIGEKPSISSSAIFVLVCVTPVIATILFGAVDPATWVILSVAAFAISALWLYDGWRRRRLLLNADVLLIPLLGLIAIGIVQLIPIFSPELPAGLVPDISRSAISMDPSATRMFLGRLIVLFVFFAAALTFVNQRSRVQKVVYLVIGFGSLMAIFAILQRLSSPEAIYGMRVPTQAIPFGPFVNQHHFAAFMEMTGGVTFGFLFAGGSKRENRILLILAAVVMGTAAVMTSSRGGLLSLGGALLFAVAASNFNKPADASVRSSVSKRRQTMVTGAVVAAIVLLVLGMVLFLRADSSLIRGVGLGGGEDVSSGRFHFWSVAIRVFADHPILGAGLDAFGAAFTRYDSWNGVFRVEQAHNDYLQTLADAGVIGFACIAAFIYFLFRKGIAQATAATDSFQRSAVIGALAGCFGIVIHSFFDFPLRTPSNAFFFLLLTAVAVVRIAPKRHHRTLTSSSLRPQGKAKLTV